jgi:hypothetical protein
VVRDLRVDDDDEEEEELVRVTIRISKDFHEEIKRTAKKLGVKHTTFIGVALGVGTWNIQEKIPGWLPASGSPEMSEAVGFVPGAAAAAPAPAPARPAPPAASQLPKGPPPRQGKKQKRR